MNVEKEIFKENNKLYWKELSQRIIKTNKISEIVILFLSNNHKISQRASYYFMTIVDIDCQLFMPYIDTIIQKLNHKLSDTQKRNIMRWLQFIEIPEKYESKILNCAISSLEHLEESIALRAYSMRVSYKIAIKYPELKNELITLMKHNVENNASAGIKNCGEKTIKLLQKL